MALSKVVTSRNKVLYSCCVTVFSGRILLDHNVTILEEHNTKPHAGQDLLLKLPGVTSKNVYALLNKAEGKEDLMGFSSDELGDLLGSAAQGKELHEGLHSAAEPSGGGGDARKRKAGDAAGGASKKSRFKARKK